MHVVRRGALHSTQCSLVGSVHLLHPHKSPGSRKYLLAGPFVSSMGRSVGRDRAWVDGRMRSSECFKGLHVDSMQSLHAVLRQQVEDRDPILSFPADA